MSDGEDFGEVLRAARAESYAAGVAEGRRLAAAEASVRLKQLGLDLVAQAHRGELVLGNASGPGAVVVATGGERLV